jgi:hypothetical protein
VNPSVTRVSPTTGPVAGGTLVTVDGTHLGGATQVQFGGTSAVPLSVNTYGTALTVRAPAAAVAGPVDVVVVTANGQSTVVAVDRYTYQ